MEPIEPKPCPTCGAKSKANQEAFLFLHLLTHNASGHNSLAQLPFVFMPAVAAAMEAYANRPRLGPPMSPDREVRASCLAAIEALAADEGNSVEILCPNPGAEQTHEERAINVCAAWTKWESVRFEGKDLSACLLKAVMAAPMEVAVSLNEPLDAAWNRRARTPLETEMVKVLADFAKWCDGWCPTHNCCANTVLPIHNAALAVLAKANAATGGGVG